MLEAPPRKVILAVDMGDRSFRGAYFPSWTSGNGTRWCPSRSRLGQHPDGCQNPGRRTTLDENGSGEVEFRGRSAGPRRSGVRSPAVRGAVPEARNGAFAAPRAGTQGSAPAPPAILTARSRSPSGGSRVEWGRQTSGWATIYLKVGQYGVREVALGGSGSAPSSPGWMVPRVG